MSPAAARAIGLLGTGQRNTSGEPRNRFTGHVWANTYAAHSIVVVGRVIEANDANKRRQENCFKDEKIDDFCGHDFFSTRGLACQNARMSVRFQAQKAEKRQLGNG